MRHGDVVELLQNSQGHFQGERGYVFDVCPIEGTVSVVFSGPYSAYDDLPVSIPVEHLKFMEFA